VTVKYNHDVNVTLFTNQSSTKNLEWKFQTTNMRSIATSEEFVNVTVPEIYINFVLNQFGIPVLLSIELGHTESVEIVEVIQVLVVKPDIVTTENDIPAATSSEQDLKAEKSVDDAKVDVPLTNEQESSENSTNSTETNNTSTPVVEELVYENKTVTRTENITHRTAVEVVKIGLHSILDDKILFSQAEKNLKIFREYEEKKIRLSEAKNRLESAVYQTRDFLELEAFAYAST